MASRGRALASAIVVVAAVLALAGSARATTFPVTNTNNSGAGSLRAAITAANAAPNPPHLIDATGVSGSIDLQSALPVLSQEVEIRGAGAGALTVRRDVPTAFRIFEVGFEVPANISGLTIANGRIPETESTNGGAGIFNNRGKLTLRDTVVTRNVNAGMAQGADGGGILNYAATENDEAAMTIINSTVSANTAAGHGGGILNSGFNTTLALVRTTVSGNTSQGGPGCAGGGGIRNHGALTVTNSTITGNSAPALGGGILSCSTTATNATAIANSTIASNTASVVANLGIVDSAPSTENAQLESTIVADPRGGGTANCRVDPAIAFTSNGFNLASDASCNLTATSDQPNTNPLLGALAANGGPTRTMALLPESPAIDKGISSGLTTDQRGLTRPVDFASIPNAPGGNGSDIGAFEVQSLTPPPEPPPPEPPSNEFSFGKVKKNKKKGTAKLTIEIVEGPGELKLAKTKKVKADDEAVESEGATEDKLTIKPKGKARRRLNERGKAKVKAEVTYTPDGGEPLTKSKRVKLKLRR